MKVKWNEEKTNIEKLIKEGVSYERIGRQYGVTGTSVKKAAKKLGIELEQKREINPSETFNKGKHFNKGTRKVRYCLKCGKELKAAQFKYCSNRCQMEHQYDEKIKEWKKNPEKFTSEHTYSFIRKYLMEKYGNKCEICGWGKENPYTHTIPLEIHHIDGDCTNNSEKNLQLLCPNHHSLTETFGSSNKDSKRYKLKKYKYNLKTTRMISMIENLGDKEKQEILNRIK